MTVWTSGLFKIFMQYAKKRPKMVKKWPFMSHKFSGFFLPKLKKMETEKFVFNAVAFDPIKIWTCLALQNGHQHLSFVKNYNVVGKK